MAKSANDKILDSIYSRAVDLSRFEEQEKQAVLKMLRDIQNNVRIDLVDIRLDPTIPKTLRGKEARLKALQKQINATINTGTAKIKRHTNKSLENLAINEGAFSESIILGSVPAEIATAINTVAISPTLLKEMATNTYIDGYTNTEWWSSIGNDLKHSFKRSVREGIARGEGIGELLKRVTANTAGNVGFKAFQAHAETLVRSSVSTVANRAREAVWDANSDIISNLKWVSTLDSRTSDVCIARDNKLYSNPDHKPIGHSYSWESGPGSLHWNCIIGSTKILNSISPELIFKRAYKGKVITINTSYGCVLTCTPNHPILTVNGWIVAGELKEGDNVIRDCGSEWIASVDTNKNDMVSSVEDITSSFIKSGKMLSVPMPITAQDFHTDGSDGEVNVIFPYCSLWRKIKTPFLESATNDRFIFRYFSALSEFMGFSHLARLFKSICPTPHGNIGFTGKIFSVLKGGIVHSGLLLFISVSRLNSIIFKDSANNTRRNAKPVSDTLNTNSTVMKWQDFINRNLNKLKRCVVSSLIKDSGNGSMTNSELSSNLINGNVGTVKPDNIVSLVVSDFSGHVYNLQTVNGFYTSNCIITHNCRSTSIPVLKDADALGIDSIGKTRKARNVLDGKVPQDTNYETWLKGQPVKVQNKVLGTTKAKLWRNGQVKSFRDLVDQTGRAKNLSELPTLKTAVPIKKVPSVKKPIIASKPVSTKSTAQLISESKRKQELLRSETAKIKSSTLNKKEQTKTINAEIRKAKADRILLEKKAKDMQDEINRLNRETKSIDNEIKRVEELKDK